MDHYDAVVCGLGAMGSAAAWHLARRGRRVLGLDRHHPPHTLGSSHGGTRIIRRAYFEHPLYVPLVDRAYELWRAAEERVGRVLLRETGGLMIGPADGDVAGGARASAERHGLPHEVLSPDEVRRRFPALEPSGDSIAVWEPDAGVLRPEACIEAHLELAAGAGAELRFDEPVLEWASEGEGVTVSTARGTVRADRLILAAGAWAGGLVPELRPYLTVERVVVYWFTPRRHSERFGPERLPVWVYEYEPGRMAYGIPDTGDGVKAGLHHQGAATDPDRIRRDVAPEETARMREVLRRFMPLADGDLNRAEVCMYTNTPEHHFIVDHHPAHPQVILAAGFSGHGFKFASVIGETLADLATEGSARFDLAPFAAPPLR